VDAPQLPDAEASPDQTGAQPPGQASAFRRALDAQLEPSDPSKALVPSGPHDLTAPIDVETLRAALMRRVPPGTPSANGPTVVAQAVSVPDLRAPTTIAAPGAAMRAAGPPPHHGADTGNSRDGDSAGNNSGNNSGNTTGDNTGDTDDSAIGGSEGKERRSKRLSTTVGISALLAAFAGAALVMLDSGRSGAPLAPTALPTKSVTHSPIAQAAPPATRSRTASPPASASRATTSPSRASATATAPSAMPSRSSAAGTSADSSPVAGNFGTLYWTTDSEVLVVDMQQRLAKLNYLGLSHDGSQYWDTGRTLGYLDGWTPNPDGIGYYQHATDSGIRAFEFEYIQHRHGQFPGNGCSVQTYQALVRATS
jgi:hypothetical protein